MDLNDYWQENKKFLTTVFAGVIVFLIGQLLITNTLSSKLATANSRSSPWGSWSSRQSPSEIETIGRRPPPTRCPEPDSSAYWNS